MKIQRTPLGIAALFILFTINVLVLSCKKDEDPVPAPVITSFSPLSGMVGSTVTITGTHFSATPADNAVAFNGIAATVSDGSTTSLTVAVPSGATSGKITVTVNGKTATSDADFTVLVPAITGFSPTSGVVGTSVTINGSNFSSGISDNVVTFNGVTATVTAATATQLTATVPAEATTGKITVTVNGKSGTSTGDFTVPAPTISGYSPNIAASGIPVIITGTNFSITPGNNIVRFNGTQATVIAATATQLTATVPVSATTGAISVKVGPHTATSANAFTICTGSPELIVSSITINSIALDQKSFTFTYRITNVGATAADLTKIVNQNYVSADTQYGAGDQAGGGASLSGYPGVGTLQPGQSFDASWTTNISSGTIANYPYLILQLFDNPDGSVPECDLNNNTVVKLVQL